VLTAGCGGRAAGSSAGGGPGGPGGPAPGGSVADRAAADAVDRAADVLTRAGTAEVATAMRMASGGTWVTVTGTGGFDFGHDRGRLTVLLPRDATGREEHKPITEVFTPGALYMKNRGAGVPAGKWVRVDTTRLQDGNLVTGGATEPLAAAELLRGARNVSSLGAARLDGVDVRHVRGTADIARAAAAASPPLRAPLRAAARGFTVTAVPFDAWFDAQGRLRRLVQRFTLAPAGSPRGGDAAGVTVTATTTYTGFGAPVRVAVPTGTDIWTGRIVSPKP